MKRRPGLPRPPEPMPANPEPQIPAPGRTSAPVPGAPLGTLIAYGGCAWCGKPTGTLSAVACIQCSVREQEHRKRMNALAERKALAEAELAEALLAEHRGGA